MRIPFLLFLSLIFISAEAQKQDYRLKNPDSLMTVLQKKMSFFEFAKFKKAHDEGNDAEKEFLLFTYSLPRSSKAKLIENLELNKDKILELEKRFRSLVPIGYNVDIEFNQMYKLMDVPGIIEIKVYEKDELLDSGDKLTYGAKKLNRILKHLNWTDDTLREIESLLKEA